MFTKFILMVIIAISSSNKKIDGPKSATELLTQKTWIPVSHGYDDNQNGSIDGFEESITDCEKDNHYSFGIDGNGFFDDKNIRCGNGISKMPFTWRFINENIRFPF